MYMRVALLRASAIAPAKDIFPCLVNEDFKAPVPAYIFESACQSISKWPSYGRLCFLRLRYLPKGWSVSSKSLQKHARFGG